LPLLIERIETAGPDHRARRLVFSGFEDARTTSAAAVRELGLEEGTEVDRNRLEEALLAAEEACARERGLRVLNYRERSVGELSKRLLDDGYPSSVVQPLVDRFVELGLVDDERFARLWARSRLAAGFGPRRISSELARRGIAPESVIAAILEAYGDEDPIEGARAALGSSHPATRQERDRALRKLLRKGYDMRTALEAIDRSAAEDV